MLSIFIFLIGLLVIFQLPISEYPEVVPPQVVVRAQFPGAIPRVISETVAAPLEKAINGVEGLLYFKSQGTSDGRMPSANCSPSANGWCAQAGAADALVGVYRALAGEWGEVSASAR